MQAHGKNSLVINFLPSLSTINQNIVSCMDLVGAFSRIKCMCSLVVRLSETKKDIRKCAGLQKFALSCCVKMNLSWHLLPIQVPLLS